MALFPGWLTARKEKQQQRICERDALLGNAHDEMLEGPEITCRTAKFGALFQRIQGWMQPWYDSLCTGETSLSHSPTNMYAALGDPVYSQSIPSAFTSLFKSFLGGCKSSLYPDILYGGKLIRLIFHLHQQFNHL